MLLGAAVLFLPPPSNLPLVGTHPSPQLLYEATLCCWELSFHRPAADVLCGSTNVVGALVDMVRLAQVCAGQLVCAAAQCWVLLMCVA